MLSDTQIKKIQSENEWLLLQLEGVNAVIKQREEELDRLKRTASDATQMQSRLDLNLIEFQSMQNKLGAKQQEIAGNAHRLEELESALLSTVKMERRFHDVLDENISLQANLKDTTEQLKEAANLYKKVRALTAELSSVKSELEIALIEIDSLKEDLKELKATNAALLKSRIE